MKKKLIFSGITVLILFVLYMEGRNGLLEDEIELLKTKHKLTEEELNYAYSMLTQEEKKKVKAFFESNHKFFKQVFPSHK